MCLKLSNSHRLWLLPPAYVVRGKVIFILGNVCLFTIGGGYLVQGLGGGYPVPGLGGEVPHLGSGWGGVPHHRSGWREGGTPSQVQVGGTPSWVQMGVPHSADGGTPSRIRMGGTPIQDWMGYPPSRPGMGGIPWGTPHPRLDGVPPHPDLGWGYPGTPVQDWIGNPPPPQSAKWALATRRVVCLLRSRRRTFLFWGFFFCKNYLLEGSQIYTHVVIIFIQHF